MAFKMNKPIIIGTKKHSALLATAKASGTVDPTLGTAAGYYGESMNPDVIDYTIKQTKIEWDKKKKKAREEEEDPKVKETLVDRKRTTANNDKEDAKNRLEETHKKDTRKPYEFTWPGDERLVEGKNILLVDDKEEEGGGEVDPSEKKEEKSFDEAFSTARKAGKKEFTWKDKKYHTRTKEEEEKKKKNKNT